MKKKIDISQFGDYRMGLTGEEIEAYLKLRAGVKELGTLCEQFNTVAGSNTGVVVKTQCCGKEIVLMYREDVERFADLVLEGKPTYWD